MNVLRILTAFFRSGLRASHTVVRDQHSGPPVPPREENPAGSGNEVPQGQLVPLDLPLPGRFYLWQPAGEDRGPRPQNEAGLYLVWVMHTPRLGELQVAAFATAHDFDATFFTGGEPTARALRAALPRLRPRLLELGYGKVRLGVCHQPGPAEGDRPAEVHDLYV